jgi:hypothetical protein
LEVVYRTGKDSSKRLEDITDWRRWRIVLVLTVRRRSLIAERRGGGSLSVASRRIRILGLDTGGDPHEFLSGEQFDGVHQLFGGS